MSSHSIKLSDDGRYIEIITVGDYNREGAFKVALESHELGKKHGVNLYLMDMTNSVNIESVADNYDFAYKDMKDAPGIDKSARVAIVVKPGDHSHDFIETVTRNAGMDVTLFTDRSKALKHLLIE